MKFSDFVSMPSIRAELAAVDKESVIAELVDSLQAAGEINGADRDDIVKSVLRREQLGSTGIGRHIAIPHSKHGSVDRLIGTLAVSHKGIPFDSLDGEPVYVLVMLISPQDRPGDHLRALENVVRTMKDETFVKNLRQAGTRDAVWHLLDEAQPPWDR